MTRLRELREARWMTQRELGEATGIAASTINRIERGLQRPHISTVRKLAEALGVTPDDIAPRKRNAPGSKVEGA